jgi:TldD protein
MKPIEPNLATHQAARDILLSPYGLDESTLLKVLGSIFTHRVDYADLYFQFTRSESWSLEELLD